GCRACVHCVSPPSGVATHAPDRLAEASPGLARPRLLGQAVDKRDEPVAKDVLARAQRALEAVAEEVRRIDRRVGQNEVEEDLELPRALRQHFSSGRIGLVRRQLLAHRYECELVLPQLLDVWLPGELEDGAEAGPTLLLRVARAADRVGDLVEVIVVE